MQIQPEYVICVNNVKKNYRTFYERQSSLKSSLIGRKNRYEDRTVLNGVSFKIKKGTAVGLIGENGCGKSTTLKLLSKIIYPDSGSIEINGKVSSLLELGAGFHPDMSGRENIYTNGSIFGLKKSEMDERMDDIISFSELGEYIDNPVRTYSSGMYMRLAFSVAVNVNADILLVDEILAVGDINFQKKCLDRIAKIKSEGTTIVIVSHSFNQIEEICDEAIWLENGLVKSAGNAETVVGSYRGYMEEKRIASIRTMTMKEDDEIDWQFDKLTIRSGNADVQFQNVWLEDNSGIKQSIFGMDDDIKIVAPYRKIVNEDLAGIASISITREDGVLCFATNSTADGGRPFIIEENGIVSVKLNNTRLLSGKYMINIALASEQGDVFDSLERALFFEIQSCSHNRGIYSIDSVWNV